MSVIVTLAGSYYWREQILRQQKLCFLRFLALKVPKWKLSVGFVLQNNTSAVAQEELVKPILLDIHINLVWLFGVLNVISSSYTKTSMMKILGCGTIGNSWSEIKCWFPHPTSNEKIYFVPDACHNLKLVKNPLGNCKVVESNLGFILWDHISNLHYHSKVLTTRNSTKIC